MYSSCFFKGLVKKLARPPLMGGEVEAAMLLNKEMMRLSDVFS